jgi:hypothetical protein
MALLYKDVATILIKWRQSLTQCRYLSQVTPHPSMTITNRNSARYIFHIYAHTAAVLLPQQIMLGFGAYFSVTDSPTSDQMFAAEDQFAQFWWVPRVSSVRYLGLKILSVSAMCFSPMPFPEHLNNKNIPNLSLLLQQTIHTNKLECMGSTWQFAWAKKRHYKHGMTACVMWSTNFMWVGITRSE